MLKIPYFDLKTGQPIQDVGPDGSLNPRYKDVSHSYLEHWLTHHGITDAQLYVAKWYGLERSDQSLDRQRLEAQGKILTWSNSGDGYFSDPQTNRLLTQGDPSRSITPLFSADRKSPHNLVAYGSLVVSDGLSSTAVGSPDRPSRILVIDDEARTHGDRPLLDAKGRPIAQADVERLYDKMGDGTMLVSSAVMTNLMNDADRDEILKTVYQQHDIRLDLTSLGSDVEQVESLQADLEQAFQRKTQQTVAQFRAATPDYPGLIKGSMATSRWCERLGVDAIISSNDIKGDDGRLSTPGIKTVSSFWVNRKSDGRYSQQSVGPQVKGCLPEATRLEFNPKIQADAQQLATLTKNPHDLLQYYVAKKDKQQAIFEQTQDLTPSRSDWVYDIGKGDRLGLLSGLSHLNYELERFLRTERLNHALQGISLPSALSQHHSQLKPWEICNKSLPHGAIVAYYRSPFPNVGAAAVAINNRDQIWQSDREAYGKAGVMYLHPWTAKHVAITDFDGDTNAVFVGYRATQKDLPAQLRQQLADTDTLSSRDQYEAGRAAIQQLIDTAERSPDAAVIRPAQFPLAVREVVERTAPDQKPPEIVKQKKQPHPWHEGESHSAAVWRAWQVTANNPTGKVANAGMNLQALAWETQYVPDEQKRDLVNHISEHYQTLLNKVERGNLTIPSDDELTAKGFPAYRFESRIRSIAEAGPMLSQLNEPAAQSQLVDQTLQQTFGVLMDFVNGPSAENLQTAVDTVKSSRGIDEGVQAFGEALLYKPVLVREHQNDSSVYLRGVTLPTNTQEPIGWNVEAINRLYQDSPLLEQPNAVFRDLFSSGSETAEQRLRALEITSMYRFLGRQAYEARQELAEMGPAARQPTLSVTSPTSGKCLTIERLIDSDPNGKSPIWTQSNGSQPNWTIYIERQDTRGSVKFLAQLSVSDPPNSQSNQTLLPLGPVEPKQSMYELGFVSAASIDEHDLTHTLQSGRRVIEQPIVQLHPPQTIQNDTDYHQGRATAYLNQQVEQIPLEERNAYLSVWWRQSESMGMVLKHFSPQLVERLQTVPAICLRGIDRDTNQVGVLPDGEYTVKFSHYHYTHASGEERQVPSVAIVTDDGREQQFASISDRSIRLPEGTVARGQIAMDSTGKTATLRVQSILSSPVTAIAQSLQVQPSQPEAVADRSDASILLESNQPIEPVDSLPQGFTPSTEPLTIVTDGACKGNPGPGGWGAILIQGDRYAEIGGAAAETTNNRMEITAGIEALKYAKAEGLLHSSTPVTIVSDSQLFINGATGTWKRNTNRDLWSEYDQSSSGVRVAFEWVRGHNGHQLNERVDQIASTFALGQTPDLVQRSSPSQPGSLQQHQVTDGGIQALWVIPFASESADTYGISSGEARKLYEAAKFLNHPKAIEVATSVGRQLKRLYNQEQSRDGDGTLLPPADYSHPTVTITSSQKAKMDQFVEAYQDAQQAAIDKIRSKQQIAQE